MDDILKKAKLHRPKQKVIKSGNPKVNKTILTVDKHRRKYLVLSNNVISMFLNCFSMLLVRLTVVFHK